MLSTLLAPLQREGPKVAMETMEWVGQIMGRLSSSDSGLRALLRWVDGPMSMYPLHHMTITPYSSPALLARLAEFCLQCMAGELPVTPGVMTTWLFVCRQLYKTGAGLVAMEKYQFHTHIANAIKKVLYCYTCIWRSY